MSGQFTASLPDLQTWAAGVMSARSPDFVIGDNYLRRWWIVPRNDYANVYLHEILASDDDRGIHGHPWSNRSFLIDGEYVEHTPRYMGSYCGPGNGKPGADEIISHVRRAGSVITRDADQAHRLEILPNGRAISLFMTGPAVREWGFWCASGWRHWKEFVSATDNGQIGRGCD